jgi:hypothetical protein
MIIVEYIESENRERRYSDQGVKLRQIETGVLYDDAVDVIPCPYTYEESDEPIESVDEEATVTDYEAALNDMGVSV